MTILSTHTVPPNIDHIRLSDYAIGIFPLIPTRKGIKKAIKKGVVWINGEPANTGRWVTSGQIIQLMEAEVRPQKVYERILDIIYEDEYLAIINKPSGIVVSGNQFRTIQNALPFNLTPSTIIDALPSPMPVHRLDHATSGLLLIAKTRTTRVALGRQFEEKKIHKRYQALVIGQLPSKDGAIEEPIEGKPSHTIYKVQQSVRSLKNDYVTFVELYPTTGRTHQLRIHLQSMGCPILGDKLYGEEGMILKHKGLFLAAVGLQFTHPITKEAIDIKIAAPAKFDSLMAREQRRWERRK